MELFYSDIGLKNHEKMVTEPIVAQLVINMNHFVSFVSGVILFDSGNCYIGYFRKDWLDRLVWNF